MVEHDLTNRLLIALQRGVQRTRIVLDPGFGFGKNFEENYPLLAHFDQLHRFGFPLTGWHFAQVVRGTHRRQAEPARMRRRRNGCTDRWLRWLPASCGGAHIVRVHDVKPAVEAAAVADEVLAAGGEG